MHDDLADLRIAAAQRHLPVVDEDEAALDGVASVIVSPDAHRRAQRGVFGVRSRGAR